MPVTANHQLAPRSKYGRSWRVKKKFAFDVPINCQVTGHVTAPARNTAAVQQIRGGVIQTIGTRLIVCTTRSIVAPVSRDHFLRPFRLRIVRSSRKFARLSFRDARLWYLFSLTIRFALRRPAVASYFWQHILHISLTFTVLEYRSIWVFVKYIYIYINTYIYILDLHFVCMMCFEITDVWDKYALRLRHTIWHYNIH